MSSGGYDRKATPEEMAAARARVRDPKLSILGVLCLPMTIAQIARTSGVPIIDAERILEELELEGKVRSKTEPGSFAGTKLFDRVLEVP